MATTSSLGAAIAADIERVLARYALAADTEVAPFGGGLINQTFLVNERAGDRRFVLQRVNALFSAAIHENIRAVTTRLAERGLATPMLVPALDGRQCIELAPVGGAGPAAVWRLMTFVDGITFDVVQSAEQARAAAALIGRFHRALEGLPHIFVGLRTGVHDTPAHLDRLARAAGEHGAHRLHAEVAPLAAAIAEAARALPPLPDRPPRIGHGDLKINNVLFAGAGAADATRAICLVDLDTVGPQPLAFELGDAWRSWCNASGEDDVEARLELGIFEASLDGYLPEAGAGLDSDDRRALLLGPEWISLELAARFAADALYESYFGWNPTRFAGRGEHNLVRARGQLSLHRAFVATRAARARMLGV